MCQALSSVISQNRLCSRKVPKPTVFPCRRHRGGHTGSDVPRSQGQAVAEPTFESRTPGPRVHALRSGLMEGRRRVQVKDNGQAAWTTVQQIFRRLSSAGRGYRTRTQAGAGGWLEREGRGAGGQGSENWLAWVRTRPTGGVPTL